VSDEIYVKSKELWIGVVEVRSLKKRHQILGNAKGAFVNIITWASDREEFNGKVELLVEDLGNLFLSEVLNPEPVETRRTRTGGGFLDDIEEMIFRAQDNPNAIIHGTFHLFENDDA
jgi:hypothetical protein